MSYDEQPSGGNENSRRSGGPTGTRVPMFNLPAVVTWLLAIMWVVHVAREWVLTQQQSFRVVIEGGFIPLRYSLESGDQSLAWLWTPITYSFLHGGYGHLIVNSIWLMAFGAIVARRVGARTFLVFWALSAICSAAFYWAFNQDSFIPVIGASGVVSALMGAAARFAFPKDGRFNRVNAHLLPRNSLQSALTNRTVLTYVAVWFGVNALAAVGFAAGAEDGARIAWEAHVGGFLFGFLAFALFDRYRTR